MNQNEAIEKINLYYELETLRMKLKLNTYPSIEELGKIRKYRFKMRQIIMNNIELYYEKMDNYVLV